MKLNGSFLLQRFGMTGVVPLTCQACHGLDGRAKIPEAPNLAGQTDIYLVKALKDYRSGARKDDMASCNRASARGEAWAMKIAWHRGTPSASAIRRSQITDRQVCRARVCKDDQRR